MEVYFVTSAVIANAYLALNKEKPRSAWKRGVNAYALELIENLWTNETLKNEDGVWLTWQACKRILLNGADSWYQYSESGNTLVCDCDIAERLCTPSELKRNRHGDRNPNGRETWLDVQERALMHAASAIYSRIIVAAGRWRMPLETLEHQQQAIDHLQHLVTEEEYKIINSPIEY